MTEVSFVDGSCFARVFLIDVDQGGLRSFVRPLCAVHLTTGLDEVRMPVKRGFTGWNCAASCWNFCKQQSPPVRWAWLVAKVRQIWLREPDTTEILPPACEWIYSVMTTDIAMARSGKRTLVIAKKGDDGASFLVVDCKLVTGQNPALSEEAAHKLQALL